MSIFIRPLQLICIASLTITSCSSQVVAKSEISPRSETSIRPLVELTTTTTADPNLEGGEAVTTVAAGLGSTRVYRGLLGRLSRNELVVRRVAEAPQNQEGVLPLLGVKGPVPERPAAVVKIDNGPGSQPQSGLNNADIVYEEPVEAGTTRFAAVFHSRDSLVGPVRSARTTDISILNGYGSPLLMYSGANVATDTLIRKQPTVQNRSFDTSSGYWRVEDRRIPTNIFAEIGPHWASATGESPPQQLEYRSSDEQVTGVDVDSVSVSFLANKVEWVWDGSDYQRNQNGKPHVLDNEETVNAKNVVVVETEERDTGMTDVAGAFVPEYVFVGTGKATVFTDGKKVNGVWTRATLADVATLTTLSGKTIKLTPGRTWFEVIAEGSDALEFS